MRFTFLIIILSSYFNINAQSLRGTITDLETGEEIPMANIVVSKNDSVINGGASDFDGNYVISSLSPGNYRVEFSFIGYQTKIINKVKISPSKATNLNVELNPSQGLEEIVLIYEQPVIDTDRTGMTSTQGSMAMKPVRSVCKLKASKRKNKGRKNRTPNVRGGRSNETVYYVDGVKVNSVNQNSRGNESYAKVKENKYLETKNNPVTTFSIDVDHASYSNIRRFINQGQNPPADAVRIEEMINYFDYNYDSPKDEIVNVETELGECPWNSKNQLLHIGLQSQSIALDDLEASNLVFLIDVSGSMSSQNKLPLVKKTLTMLTKQLRKEDRISIVVYSGAAGCVLKSTPGNDKSKIFEALSQLQSGGSTAGGEGIELAYEIAEKNFINNGNNRVILATDGDFNVGVSSNASLEDLISKKRKSNVFLTVLGYGMGNLKDDKLEILANKGNGNYAYINNTQEAQDYLVKGFKSSMFTLAKDVKLQLEFNPKFVKSYRLIGYENRALDNSDFADDNKDAGELGAEQSVTALYEIVPQNKKKYSALKFQSSNNLPELFDLRIRYKVPKGKKSKKISQSYKVNALALDDTSNRFKFSSAVALFGLILKDSDHKKKANCYDVIELAKLGKGEDEKGYKSEFIRLVESYNSGLVLNEN